jgi:hypothetical protein
MLSYEDRLTVPLDVREEFRGLALQSCHEFSTHGVIL